ncbi:PH domain-containing protein [Patescibacteria group bacterium]|nr:MAG: PH domain-containing protein [Patescibacteria group bacterium]
MVKVSLRPGEEIKKTVRQHWIFIAVPLFFSFFLLTLAFFLLFPLFGSGPAGLLIFLLIIFLAALVALRSWVLWRSTVFLITNQRVIDVDRTGFFRWVISDLRYENLADISYETKGPLQALCQSGNVTLSTISGSHAIEGRFIPRPDEVREAVIVELKGSEQRSGADPAPPPAPERSARRYEEHLKKKDEMENFFGNVNQ